MTSVPELREFIIVLRPTRPAMVGSPTPEEAARVGEHFRYLSALCEQGIVVLAGRTIDDQHESTFGVCIIRAADEARAREILDNDPVIKHNVMTGELRPFRIALHSRADISQ